MTAWTLDVAGTIEIGAGSPGREPDQWTPCPANTVPAFVATVLLNARNDPGSVASIRVVYNDESYMEFRRGR